MIENADAVPLNRPGVQFFVQNYLPNFADCSNPLIASVRANLQNLPPITIVAAEIDPLRTDGQTLADRFRAAGVPVRYQLYSGVTHEFLGRGRWSPKHVTPSRSRRRAFARRSLSSSMLG